MPLAFEDFPTGRFGSFGPRHVTREEIIAFATEFDPQSMHLDEEAAKASMLQGCSGSGWHLCSIVMRMMFDGYIGRTASLGSPGVNEMRWLAPPAARRRSHHRCRCGGGAGVAQPSETGIVTFSAGSATPPVRPWPRWCRPSWSRPRRARGILRRPNHVLLRGNRDRPAPRRSGRSPSPPN